MRMFIWVMMLMLASAIWMGALVLMGIVISATSLVYLVAQALNWDGIADKGQQALCGQSRAARAILSWRLDGGRDGKR